MKLLTPPPGKKLGCLPRKSKFGKLAGCPPMADVIATIPQKDWGEYLGKVNLRKHVRVVLDQDGVGSCATESTTQSVMIQRDVASLPFELLNPWSIYYWTSGGRDGGSNIDSNLAHARKYGILPESYWPRSKGWRTKPPSGWEEKAALYRIDEFFDIRNTTEVGSALLLGYTVVFGWSGHSCILTSLLDTATAEYLNSWHESWGDHGFGKIKLKSINFDYGAFAVRTAISTGGQPIPTPRV